MESNKQIIEFGSCCFCGKSIVQTQIDPCRITVETSKGLWQLWFSHAECFKQRIAENPDIDLTPAHF